MEPDLESIASAAFPVKLNDGFRYLDLGTVTVYPSMPFKSFQEAISQKVGLAPHQISTSLVRRKKGGKIPIGEASDFAAIAREKDSFVLVSRRRPRKERRSRTQRGHLLDGVVGYREEVKKSAAAAVLFPERMILRSNPTAGLGGMDQAAAIGGLMPDVTAVSLGMWDYDYQMRNLQQQRERFLMSTAATAYNPYFADAAAGGYLLDAPAAAFGAATQPGTPASAPSPPICRECKAAAEEEGRAPGFHSCVYDAVIEGFRTKAGPIQRPPKKHVEASVELDKRES